MLALIKKTKNLIKTNLQLIITFNNPIFNNLKLNIHNEQYEFPLHSEILKSPFKYPISLWDKISNSQKFSNTLARIHVCNVQLFKNTYINSHLRHIITGNLVILN